MTIGKNIKALREELGMTQEQLAEKLNISYQAISKWENAQSVPDTMMLPAIAKTCCVTIDELFRENQESYDNLASKLAAIFEDTKKKEDFQLAELAYNRLFTEGKYTARDLNTYGYINWYFAWTCFHIAEDYFNRAMEMAKDENDRIYRDALSYKICLKADMNQIQHMIHELHVKCNVKPDSIVFRNALITAYINANQYEDAEQMIDKAIAAGYDEWFLYQNKGDILQSKNLLNEALSCFEKAWKIDSETYCDTLYSFVCIYKQMGNKEKAIEYCQKWISWYEKRGAIIEKRVPERELEKLIKS
ncbi:MAG: putative HTH-type transcriptional regulator [Herbinix sp.]|jgi:transcriptional regulator with XRE-family HTH domain|nr:putative HTH-type transcriptional regulator [Herbinix sp.]